MRVLSASVLAVALVLGACAGSTEDDDVSQGDEALTALTITEAGNNKTFTVEKGKDVKVVLPANATTGYKWTVASTNRTFGYPTPKDGTYQGGGANGPVGSGGKTTFVWKTNSPILRPSTAAHKVVLEYRRPFESDDAPAAKTFTFKVKIKEAAAEPPPAPPGRPIVLFEEHDKSTIQATVGQVVTVRLAENPTTGYRWHVESVDRTLGQPDKTFEGPGASGPVGSGGTAVMTWKTDGPLNMVGSHLVKLKYSRGETGAAAQTFEFTLNIAAADAENEFACPPESLRTINCMPIVSPRMAPYCAGDYRSWAQDNCEVSYLD